MAKKNKGNAGNGFGHRDGAWNQGKIEDNKAEKRKAQDKRDKQRGWRD